GGDLPAREGPGCCGAGDRLLPDRGAFQPHLVRAGAPARLRERAQLRRILDRVGEHGPRAYRCGQRTRRGPESMTAGATAELPEALGAIVEDFTALSQTDRLQLLLEFSQGLPDLPERYTDHPEL